MAENQRLQALIEEHGLKDLDEVNRSSGRSNQS